MTATAYFDDWMSKWSRKIFIAKVLGRVTPKWTKRALRNRLRRRDRPDRADPEPGARSTPLRHGLGAAASRLRMPGARILTVWRGCTPLGKGCSDKVK